MNVKFNKHRIFIIFSLMFLLIVVSVLCSFAPPSFSSTVDSFSNLNQSEVDLIFSVFGHMDELGYFTGSIPVICYYSSNLSTVRLICIKPGDTYQLSSTGITTSTGSTFRYELTADGFCLKTLITNSTISFTSSRILFSRSTVNDPFVINSSFAFASGSNARDSLVDMASYWYDLYNIVLNYEDNLSSAVSEAYSEGLATGQGEGFDIGLEQGYNQGYDSGFADGEDRGYIEGQTEGFSEGFSEGYSEGESVGSASGYRDGFDDGQEVGFNNGYESGYDDGYKRGDDVGFNNGYESGYDEGYSDGYETGLNEGSGSEPLQIYRAYIFRFDENNSLEYSWYNDSLGLFFWVDYNSRFDATKPPYTFIVRLTESDLNNSSTQIELPFDFISSPLNRDYSVTSFDTDFLTGYGNSISLFVSTARSYNNGYNVGLQDGADLLDGISDISAKPIAALRDALDFELFGVNIGLVVIALVSVIIVFAAYKFVKKIFPI